MLVISLLRILFDTGILYLFVSMANPRQDSHNPFCLMLQYTSFPFAARLFPDFVAMGAVSIHEKPSMDVTNLLVYDHGPSPDPVVTGPKAILPLRPEIIEVFQNSTAIENFLTIRDNTFKYFLNISILVFMYLGTLLTWAAVRKAQVTEERVEMKKMRKIYSILLYFCICIVWMFCNTESMRNIWRDTMNNRYGSVFMINVLAWSFLLITIRVTYHCVQILPPKTSHQCNFLQNYLAILNLSVWYSFVAFYFAYNFYKPNPTPYYTFPFTGIPFDENLLVSLLFLFSFAFSPPYRHRLPLPAFVSMKTTGSLPEMQERFRNQERAALKQQQKEEKCVKLQMEEGTVEPPPAYEVA